MCEYTRTLCDRFVAAPRAAVPGQLPAPANYDSGAHHMGTCRMGATPEPSVVDSHRRVPGAENVFLAGSSIFVVGSGVIQPTLALNAFAIRTADQIVESFR